MEHWQSAKRVRALVVCARRLVVKRAGSRGRASLPFEGGWAPGPAWQRQRQRQRQQQPARWARHTRPGSRYRQCRAAPVCARDGGGRERALPLRGRRGRGAGRVPAQHERRQAQGAARRAAQGARYGRLADGVRALQRAPGLQARRKRSARGQACEEGAPEEVLASLSGSLHGRTPAARRAETRGKKRLT